MRVVPFFTGLVRHGLPAGLLLFAAGRGKICPSYYTKEPYAMQDHPHLIFAIRRLLSQKEWVIVAIDGRCGSGKTTLAAELQ